jgi:histidyl-tRNA synthetase
MSKIAAPRGTADVYPPGSSRWQALEARTGAIARRFGYGEIRTPLFESTELFVRGVGETTDIVEKEMYTFQDKSGRSLTLRPEWTAPVVRALLEHNLLANGPQRLYYCGPFFRYERPQAGRYRQANQFGVECFGFAGPEADVEVISLADDVLRSYRLPGVTLHVNSIGDDVCRPRYRAALFAHFDARRSELSPDSQSRLDRNPLRILDSKAPEDRAAVESAPTVLDTLCAECAAHFAQVCAYLDAIGIHYVVDPRIVRGLDYYTRTVFEFVADNIGAQSTVCGGGRYDGLIASLGGPPTPGVGFGMGLERLLMVLEGAGLAAPPEPEGIAVIALGAEARRATVPLIAALRRACEYPVTSDYADAKVGNQLKRADRANARAALIVGDDELRDGAIVARDLARRVQERLETGTAVESAVASVRAWYATLPMPGEASEAV